MLKRKESEQMQLELVTYDILVRPDHLLRKIDSVIDFSFIHDLCAPLYCADNGRPAIDPDILFRMLFVGYLYGIRSEVRLCEEIQDNTAYRWFYQALHRFDFAPLLTQAWRRDALIIILSLMGGALCLSGCVLGWRRLFRQSRSAGD